MVKSTIILLVLYFSQFYISSLWGKYFTKLKKQLRAGARVVAARSRMFLAHWSRSRLKQKTRSRSRLKKNEEREKNQPAPQPCSPSPSFYFFFKCLLLTVAVWVDLSSVFISYHIHVTCNLLLIFNLFRLEEVVALNLLLCLVLTWSRLEIEVVSYFLSVPTLRYGHVSESEELDIMRVLSPGSKNILTLSII